MDVKLRDIAVLEVKSDATPKPWVFVQKAVQELSNPLESSIRHLQFHPHYRRCPRRAQKPRHPKLIGKALAVAVVPAIYAKNTLHHLCPRPLALARIFRNSRCFRVFLPLLGLFRIFARVACVRLDGMVILLPDFLLALLWLAKIQVVVADYLE